MKNLLNKEPFLVQLGKLLGEIAGEVLTIILGFFMIIVKCLYLFRKWEWRFLVAGFILFTAYTATLPSVYAPKSAYAMNGQKQMVVHPDLGVKEIVLSMAKYEFGEDQVQYVDKLLTKESGFDPKVINPNSGACGIFQSLPCGKMLSMNLQDQMQFGFDYIKNRYGNPLNAWKHEVANNWY